MKLHFTVDNLNISYNEPSESVVNDSTNYVKAIFSFSGDIWEKSTIKTAVFHQLNKAYSVILTDNWCYVPPEVLKNNGFSVGVMTSYADENTTKTVYTKSPCAVYTSPSCYAESFANSMTQSQYEQIMELLASGDFGGGGGGNVTITYDEATESLQIGGSGVSIEFDEATGNLNISSGTSQAAEPFALSESGEVSNINGYDLKDKTAREMLESVDFEGLAEISKELDEGKILSSNDFTDDDKSKLDGIDDNAQVNVIEKIYVNNKEQSVAQKEVNISVPTNVNELAGVDKLALKSDIINVYKYKGSVSTAGQLPTDNLTVGDVYNVEDTGKNVAWDGYKWDDLGGIFECAIENVKVNGAIVPIENKAVDISVPTKLSDLENDSGYLITKKYTNVTVLVSDFVEDSTFEDYPYKADIAIDGVTENDYANINFELSDVQSKNYASICTTSEGIISIYAINVPSTDIVIPLIEVVKV